MDWPTTNRSVRNMEQINYIKEYAKELGSRLSTPFVLKEVGRPDIRVHATYDKIIFRQCDWNEPRVRNVLVNIDEDIASVAEIHQSYIYYSRPLPTYEQTIPERKVATEVRGGLFSSYVHEYTTIKEHTETKVDYHEIENLIIEALNFFPLDPYNLYGFYENQELINELVNRHINYNELNRYVS